MAKFYLNRATIAGNVGRDPEVRHFPSGDAVMSFSVATTESWKDKAGEWQEKTEWHNVSVMGKLADYLVDKLHKGDQVFVEGQIQTRKWNDKDGNERYTTEIKVGFNGMVKVISQKGEAQTPDSPRAKAASKGGDMFPEDVPF